MTSDLTIVFRIPFDPDPDAIERALMGVSQYVGKKVALSDCKKQKRELDNYASAEDTYHYTIH